jgi:hypothetical protein
MRSTARTAVAWAVVANLALHAVLLMAYIAPFWRQGHSLAGALGLAVDELPVPYGWIAYVFNLPAFLASGSALLALEAIAHRTLGPLARVFVTQSVYLSVSSLQIALLALGLIALRRWRRARA